MTKGFSLLETIIYIGLTSIILSSLISVAFQIITATGDIEKADLALEEGDYLEHKIKWILNNVVEVNLPIAGESSSTLEFFENGESSPIWLEEAGNNLTLNNGDGPAPLNSSAVSISDFSVQNRISASSTSFLKISFKVNNYPFEVTKYFP